MKKMSDIQHQIPDQAQTERSACPEPLWHRRKCQRARQAQLRQDLQCLSSSRIHLCFFLSDSKLVITAYRVCRYSKGNNKAVDEAELVKQVKPVIEDAKKILNETNSAFKASGLDGRPSSTTKQNFEAHTAGPEEQRLTKALSVVHFFLIVAVTQCEPVLIYYNMASDRYNLSLLMSDFYEFLRIPVPSGTGYIEWTCNIPRGYGLYGLVASNYRQYYLVVKPGRQSSCLRNLTRTYPSASYATSVFSSYTGHPPSSRSPHLP